MRSEHTGHNTIPNKYMHVVGYRCIDQCDICEEEIAQEELFDDPFSPESIRRELARRGDAIYDNCPEGWENFSRDPDYGGWDIGDHGY